MSVSYLITRTTDINRGIRRDNLGQLFAYADSMAQTFQISVLSNGAAADLSGYTALGYFNRPKGDTVVIPGTIADNVVTVNLPEACYAQTGRFDFIIRLTDGESSKIAIYWGDGVVRVAQSDVIIDPGDVVPSLEELLAKIDQMETATSAANTAAANATEAANHAVRYDAAQTLTDAQKTQAKTNIGAASEEDVSALKSAFGYISEDENLYIDGVSGVYNGNISVGTSVISYSATAKTVYVECKPNTVYTVSKTAGKRFAVGSTAEVPKNNVAVISFVQDNEASSIQYTTPANATYLVAYVYASLDSITATEMLGSVRIVEVTAKDNIARAKIETLEDDTATAQATADNAQQTANDAVGNNNIKKSKIAFTVGALTGQGGYDDTKTSRVRFAKRIFVYAGSSVSVDSGDYKFNLATFSEDSASSMIQYYGMRTGNNPIVIDQDCYIMSCMGKTDDSVQYDPQISEHYVLNLITEKVSEYTSDAYNDRHYLEGIEFAPINDEKAIFGYDDSPFDTFNSASVFADLISFIDNRVAEKVDADNTIASGYGYVHKTDIGRDASGTYQMISYDCYSPKGMGLEGEIEKHILQKPTFVIVGGQHGDEKGAPFACAHLIDLLTNKWETNPVLEYLHWNTRLVFVPCGNPWGMTNNNYLNSNRVNLNKNWGYNFVADTEPENPNDNTGAHAFSETETQLIKNVIASQQNVVSVIDFHINNSTISNPQWILLNWLSVPTETELLNSDIINIMNKHGYKLSRQFNREYSLGFPDAKKFYYVTQSSSANRLKGYAEGVMLIPSITLEGSAKCPDDETTYTARTNKMNTEILANWLYNTCLEYAKYAPRKN